MGRLSSGPSWSAPSSSTLVAAGAPLVALLLSCSGSVARRRRDCLAAAPAATDWRPCPRCRCRRRPTCRPSWPTRPRSSSSARRCSGTCRSAATACRRARAATSRAGADTRVKNQLNPGRGRRGGGTFIARPTRRSEHTLTAADFPFHRLADPNDRDSRVLFADTTTSSRRRRLQLDLRRHRTPARRRAGDVRRRPASAWTASHAGACEPRNAPTVINAVFNFRNFWDGRASHVQRRDPFGARDPDARRVAGHATTADQPRARGPRQHPQRVVSAASQAVGPPLSDFEMSARRAARFRDIGKKLLSLVPLSRQKVVPTDSVLGPLRGGGRAGSACPRPTTR